jgi:putative hydrolase of the HAD superfamily
VEAISSRWKQDAAYWAHECGELDDRGFFSHLRRTLQLDIEETEMLAGWNAVLGEPLPGSEPLVRRLAAEYPLYVFSNTNPAHIAHFTPRYERLLDSFKKIVTSCELRARKPEPEAFRRLLKAVGAKQALFFDDLEENVLGARAAGLEAYRVTGPEEIASILQKRSAR